MRVYFINFTQSNDCRLAVDDDGLILIRAKIIGVTMELLTYNLMQSYKLIYKLPYNLTQSYSLCATLYLTPSES